MTKTLRVIAPFFVAEIGDKFELNDSGLYSLEKSEEFYKIAGDDTSDVRSSFSSMFSISQEYAKQLIEEEYLEEMIDKKDTRAFVNVFDEIDSLIEKYTSELNTLDKDMKNEPQCLVVEKTTVLNNIIKVLNYLKNLKK